MGREWLKFFVESRGVGEEFIIKVVEFFDVIFFLDKRISEYLFGMLKRILFV